MFERSEVALLKSRLAEPRRCIQVLLGPRQVGKSTVVDQVLATTDIPSKLFQADSVYEGNSWVESCWEGARLQMKAQKAEEFLIVFDEIQKIKNWSEAVKKEWDADTRNHINIKVVLTGSSRIMVSKGLSESLMGRFEEIRITHWTYPEMKAAFGLSLPEYIYFGGYPGAVSFYNDERRWRAFITSSVIDATINRDILMDSPVGKPALLRQTFEMATRYSGEILSVTKMLGQLQDAGNTTTLSGYINLLNDSGLVGGLFKYAAGFARQRASAPKFQVHNSALRTVKHEDDQFEKVQFDLASWGRYVESAAGAYLLSQAFSHRYQLFYWRDGADEVDFVLSGRGRTVALEVKSNTEADTRGLRAFREKFHPDKALIVGPAGLDLETFYSCSLDDLLD